MKRATLVLLKITPVLLASLLFGMIVMDGCEEKWEPVHNGILKESVFGGGSYLSIIFSDGTVCIVPIAWIENKTWMKGGRYSLDFLPANLWHSARYRLVPIAIELKG